MAFIASTLTVRRMILMGFMALTLFAGLWGCGEKPAIKIGFAGPLSGTLSDFGLACRRGAVLAIEQINQAGGIHGRSIELIVKDDKNDPKEAIAVDRALIQEGVVSILAHFTSTASMAAVPEMNQEKMLLISPGASTTQLSDLDDYFLRIVAPHTGLAKGMANDAYHTVGARSAGIMFDIANRAYSESYVRAAAKTFQQFGGETVVEIPFDSKEGVSEEDLHRLIQAAPDALFVVAGALDTAFLVQELSKQNKKIQIYSSGWAMKKEFIENGGRAADGVRFSVTADISQDVPTLTAFKNDYQERFGEAANMASVLGYDAVSALKIGLKQAKSLTPVEIKKAILDARIIPGLHGDFPINSFGDPERPTYIYVVKNGKFQLM